MKVKFKDKSTGELIGEDMCSYCGKLKQFHEVFITVVVKQSQYLKTGTKITFSINETHNQKVSYDNDLLDWFCDKYPLPELTQDNKPQWSKSFAKRYQLEANQKLNHEMVQIYYNMAISSTQK